VAVQEAAPLQHKVVYILMLLAALGEAVLGVMVQNQELMGLSIKVLEAEAVGIQE
jgi:hypothetical protein